MVSENAQEMQATLMELTYISVPFAYHRHLLNILKPKLFQDWPSEQP